MVTITKKQVSDWVLLDYMSQKHVFEEKLSFFENKYKTDIDSFEQQLETANTESFQSWDDLIEWKAYTQLLSEINAKITDVRNGDFQMAE